MSRPLIWQPGLERGSREGRCNRHLNWSFFFRAPKRLNNVKKKKNPLPYPASGELCHFTTGNPFFFFFAGGGKMLLGICIVEFFFSGSNRSLKQNSGCVRYHRGDRGILLTRAPQAKMFNSQPTAGDALLGPNAFDRLSSESAELSIRVTCWLRV